MKLLCSLTGYASAEGRTLVASSATRAGVNGPRRAAHIRTGLSGGKRALVQCGKMAFRPVLHGSTVAEDLAIHVPTLSFVSRALSPDRPTIPDPPLTNFSST